MTPRDYLFGLELHGIKLGLENITHLLEKADAPHRACPIVHIAGTNGKGSVVAMLDAMLRAAGYRTARFTSPHLIDLNERFIIDGVPVADALLDDAIAFFQQYAEPMTPPPTFFELNTAVAFRLFAQADVDIALIEVGMGGRLDSTNVVAPAVCAITNIDLEHTQYLGDSLEAIAAEKAGILKRGVPAIVAERKPAARDVILARAAELACPVRLAGRDYQYSNDLEQGFAFEGDGLAVEGVTLGLRGTYQGENAATAAALAAELAQTFPKLDARAVATGLHEARWPCRLERVLESPPVIIDVAHNAAGAHELTREVSDAIVVLAVSSDKDATAMVDALAPQVHALILTQFDGPRALSAADLCAAAGTHPHERIDTLETAIALGMRRASDEHPLVIAGSIFTGGQARHILIETYAAPPLRF